MADNVRGSLDMIINGHVAGWALSDDPAERVVLVVSVNGQDCAEIVADRPRPGLQKQGHDDVRHGFLAALPADAFSDGENLVSIRARDHAQFDGRNSLRIGPPGLAGAIGYMDQLDGMHARGWVAHPLPDSDAMGVELVIDGRGRGIHFPTRLRPDMAVYGLADRPCGLYIRLPDDVADGREHCIELRLPGAAEPLPGGPHTFRAELAGQLESAHIGRVLGWAINRSAPDVPVQVDIHINGAFAGRVTANEPRTDQPAGPGSTQCGFAFAVPEHLRRDGHYTAQAFHAGGSEPLGAPVTWLSRAAMTQGLQALATLINDGRADTLPAGTAGWLRQTLLPELQRQLRTQPPGPLTGNLNVAPWVRLPAGQVQDNVVDIILVATHAAATLPAIARALATTDAARRELILVAGSDTNSELLATLRTRAGQDFTLLETDALTAAFGGIARAIALHPARDVVLLETTAEVSSGWLERLQAAAASDAGIATVSTFSNRASACGFPALDTTGRLPAGTSAAEIDDACRRHNDGLRIEIPVAAGPCIYVRRRALSETSLPDARARASDVPEEFSLYAAVLGWRHVLAADLFVGTRAVTQALGDNPASRLPWPEPSAGLQRHYPDYRQALQRWAEEDPALPARRAVLRELLQRRAPAWMLFVTRPAPNPEQAAVTTLAEGLAAQGTPVLFLSAQNDTWSLQLPGTGLRLDYPLPQDYMTLRDDLRALGVWHVHYHHLAGFTGAIFFLFDQAGLACDVTVHDHLAICPRTTLVDGSGRYCGEPDTDGCDRCVRGAGTLPALTNLFRARGDNTRAWRDSMQRFLADARRVFVPDADAAERLRRYYTLDNLVVQPHPQAAPAALPPVARRHDEDLLVAVPGPLHNGNGLARVLDCAADAGRRRLPLRFVVLGSLHGHDDTDLPGNITVTGDLPAGRAMPLARALGCTVALFPDPSPATSTQAMDDAVRHGLYPVVPARGAAARQATATGHGLVYDDATAALQLNDRLAALAGRIPLAPTSAASALPGNLLRDYYGIAGTDSAAGGHAVCVLGMHRSGTSSLAGALMEGGIAAGDVMRFGPDNVKGHIESPVVIGLNEDILQYSGGSWDHPPADIRWTAAHERRRALYVGEMQRSAGTWVFKDPRTLLTLPFWRGGIAQVTCVGTFRHPLNVAFSLYQRDGLALADGLRAWIAYNRRLVDTCRAQEVPLVCFDLPEQAYLAALDQALGRVAARLDAPLDLARARGFFARELRDPSIPQPWPSTPAPEAAALLAEAVALHNELLALAGVAAAQLTTSADFFPLTEDIGTCTDILARQPDNLYALTLLARLQSAAGNAAAVIDARRRLVELAPHNYLALRAYLEALQAEGRLDELIAAAEARLTQHARNPDLHLRLAEAYEARGDRTRAADCYAVARDAGYAYYHTVSKLAAVG